jgi:hypothetical protein
MVGRLGHIGHKAESGQVDEIPGLSILGKTAHIHRSRLDPRISARRPSAVVQMPRSRAKELPLPTGMMPSGGRLRQGRDFNRPLST